MTTIIRARVAYQTSLVTQATHTEQPKFGIVSIESEAVIWQSETDAERRISIPIEQIISVELPFSEIEVKALDQSYVLLHTSNKLHIFVCNKNSGLSNVALLAAIRKKMAEQFTSVDEIIHGNRPPRYRGIAGPHIVLAVSDLTWGENVANRALKVEVSTLQATFSWKKRVFLAEDIHLHLKKQFDALIDNAAHGADIGELCRDLGGLLLHNTISAAAIQQIDALSPSLITLRVDELLTHLPWSVIYDGHKYVQLYYALAQQISTIGSVNIYKKPIENRRRLLILSNPTLDLPGTEAEAKSIIATFKELHSTWEIVHLTGVQVTRAAVMTALSSGRYEIIHYAGHGHFDQIHSTESAWRLYDGPLTAIELQQNVEGNPPLLVYASACEAGREETWGSWNYQQQLFGLASAFLQGGVYNYIGSFWPIPDTDAARLAQYFYSGFLKDIPIAEAMRTAKCKLADSGASLLWGGMTLFGDPSTRISLFL